MSGLSNLPPGCTDADIERNATGGDSDVVEALADALRDLLSEAEAWGVRMDAFRKARHALARYDREVRDAAIPDEDETP